jgi:glyoxylase-like metal-dependent hydrolase (beta-lactamase superfamily II)
VVETRAFPSFAKADAMNASLDRLLAMRGPDTKLIFGHDPGQWGEAALLPDARS